MSARRSLRLALGLCLLLAPCAKALVTVSPPSPCPQSVRFVGWRSEADAALARL